MVGTAFLSGAFVVGTCTLALAQPTSAPLLVTATVVASCKMDIPRQVERSGLSTMPVHIVCTRRSDRHGDGARVQRPLAPRRSTENAVLLINF